MREVVADKICTLKSENATLQVQLMTLSKTQEETILGLANNLEEMRGDFGKKMRERDELRAMDSNL